MTTDNDTPKTVDQLTSTESLQASETEMPEAPAAPTEEMPQAEVMSETEEMPQAEATETTPYSGLLRCAIWP